MQREIAGDIRVTRRHRWVRPALGIIGGVLYIVMALAVMQVAFYVWSGMW